MKLKSIRAFIVIFFISIVFLSFYSCKKTIISEIHYIENNLSDSLWNSVEFNKLCYYNLGKSDIKGNNDLSAGFKMMWDTSNLYIFINVVDETKFDITKFKYKMDVPSAYNCDCIELFFDMKNHKTKDVFDAQDDDYRYEFVYNREEITGTFKSKNGIIFNQIDDPSGYIFKISIPFKTLEIKPSINYTFGFGITVSDNDQATNLPYYNFDNRSAISWSEKEGTDAWKNVALLGSIILVK